jgi:hypothetical protein
MDLLAVGASPADFAAARTQMAFTLGFHIILASILTVAGAVSALHVQQAQHLHQHAQRVPKMRHDRLDL